MLYYDRTDVSEGIDVNNTSGLKEDRICHYWYFYIKGLRSTNLCNGCSDILMMFINLSNIAISNIHGADYRYIITGISKNEGINLMHNIDLSEKGGALESIKIYFPV